MDIKQPFINNDIPLLLADKKIIEAGENSPYKAFLFPESTELRLIDKYDSSRIITKIDDVLFSDFIILNKEKQNVFLENNTKRKYIQSIEIGSIDNSVKRYNNINKPINYSRENIQDFINLPKYNFDDYNKLNVSNKLSFGPIDNEPRIVNEINEQPIDHPHINIQKTNESVLKFNDKGTIEQIFRWAKEQGIKYIYCIIENRPFVINNKYVLPYVYYTIKGAYDNTIPDIINPTETNIIDNNKNDFIDDGNNDIVYF